MLFLQDLKFYKGWLFSKDGKMPGGIGEELRAQRAEPRAQGY